MAKPYHVRILPGPLEILFINPENFNMVANQPDQQLYVSGNNIRLTEDRVYAV